MLKIFLKNKFLLSPLSNTVDRIWFFLMRIFDCELSQKTNETSFINLNFFWKQYKYFCVLGVLLSKKSINKLIWKKSSNWKLWINLIAKMHRSWFKGVDYNQTTLHMTSVIYIEPCPPSNLHIWLKNSFEVTMRQWAIVLEFQENNWQVRIFNWPCKLNGHVLF